MKRITLCADDYGYNPDISAGICKLIELQRITATTCMTSLPSWQQQAKPLQNFRQNIDIGLHFNLCDGQSLGKAPSLTNASGDFLGIKKLTLKSFARLINSKDVEDELNRQLDSFVSLFGTEPDFIDGHVHIHHFPIIREVLLKVYEQRLRRHNSYIRISSQLGFMMKKIMITGTGSLSLKNKLERHQIPFNTSFSGIYNFRNSANYRKFFKKFLQEINNDGLIMCHPGLKSTTTNFLVDPIAATRFYEFQYLSSDQFLEDCAAQQIKLTRMWKTKTDPVLSHAAIESALEA